MSAPVNPIDPPLSGRDTRVPERQIYTDGHRTVYVAASEPSAGGAYAKYECVNDRGVGHLLQFQYDTITAIGVCAWTNETLLAVLKHRLEGFQAGPFSCRENMNALQHVKDALFWLEQRTKGRQARGVEGKHEA